MNVIIDLDLNQVVQGWGNRNPTDPIVVKSQDTPVMAIYFGKGQASYDLGASPGVRFALYVLGNPNALVDQSGFVRNVDSQNKTAYVAYPNFNTTQMQAAMAGLATINAVGEVRYQTPFGTIARTLDIPFTVNRSLLQESAYDTTTAAFTVPAVNGTVTLHINHTGWLAPNQNITIGNGGGAYQVVSVTNPTDFVAKNLGGTANAAPATVIPTGTTVGNTPTSALGVYPDPSTIELLTHKNQPNGYAGLNGASKLAGSTLPVDGSTIVINSGGNLAAASILAITGANFTTPAANSTVSVTFVSTSGLVPNIYVRIPIAGYYLVQSITDATHAVLQNVGDPLNAVAGTTITSGAPLLPAQAVAGGGGSAGPPGPTGPAGVSAFTTTLAAFTMPTSGATVTVNVALNSWMAQGQNLFIPGAGYFSVAAFIDATHVVLTNSGTSGNAPAGTSVASGSQVSPAGSIGPAGPTGASGSTGGIGEAPTDGQQYARQSSAWAVVTGGGGGGPILPSARDFEYDDFISTISTTSTISATAAPVGKLGWLAKISGGAGATIASGASQGYNTTDKVNGAWLFTATATGDSVSISLGDYSGTVKPTLNPGLGILSIEFRINLGVLPGSANDTIIELGIGSGYAITAGYPTDGVFFQYAHYVNSDDLWRFYTVSGGTRTTIATGVTATTTGWHKFKFTTNAGWTSIQAFIDGTAVGSPSATNIPGATLCPVFRMSKQAGSAAVQVYLDYFFKDYQYTR